MKIVILDKKKYAVPENTYSAVLSVILQASVEADTKPEGLEFPVATIVLEDESKRYCCSSLLISFVTILKMYGGVEVSKKLSSLEKELIDADCENMENFPRGIRRLKYAVERELIKLDWANETKNNTKNIVRSYNGDGRSIGDKMANTICQELNVNLPELFICSVPI